MSHPIHILWCHPRSMSTAVERVMRERGDLTILHEPLINHYYIRRGTRTFPNFEPDPEQPQDYWSVRETMIELARRGPVFAKDQAYYALDELLEDEEFLRRVRHAFLVRDPRAAVLSYYRKDPDLLDEEVGLVSQLRLHDRLRELGIASVILRSEIIQTAAEAELGRWWAHSGLSSAPHAFRWSRGAVEDWNFVSDWHDKVQKSTGFEVRPFDPDAFRDMISEAPHLAEYLAEHEPAYRALVERAQ